ncbi:hypothetical protein [Endozoicomonas sp. ALB122]|uniref:hypothetical protein n=2 Tax=Endozoicomonas TaxID=305899 RepID=UPI003BB7D296
MQPESIANIARQAMSFTSSHPLFIHGNDMGILGDWKQLNIYCREDGVSPLSRKIIDLYALGTIANELMIMVLMDLCQNSLAFDRDNNNHPVLAEQTLSFAYPEESGQYALTL